MVQPPHTYLQGSPTGVIVGPSLDRETSGVPSVLLTEGTARHVRGSKRNHESMSEDDQKSKSDHSFKKRATDSDVGVSSVLKDWRGGAKAS